MFGFVGDYARWCYSRDGISVFADIHDNLLFRFVFAPIGETLLFAAPFLAALCIVNVVADRVRSVRS